MIRKPVIFISATSDLRSARELVAKVLYSLGYEPVWQDIEATDGGELIGVLRQRIERCDMMVQLVGHRYGAEPPRPTVEFGRVSYTQFEALEAERLHKKVIYHFLGDAFPADAASAESAELTSLQTAYHQRVKDENRLRYSGIANATELELSIHKIRDELAAVREQSDRRFRNVRRLMAISVLGIVLIAVLAFITLRRESKTQTVIDAKTAELNNKLEAIAQQLQPLTDPKPQGRQQAQAEVFSPEVIEKAKTLVKFGDAEQRAIGYMFAKRHADADRIIKDLQSRPGNTPDDQFRFFTLEGNNCWLANEPDKAITPYEEAVKLKPTNVKAQCNLAVVLSEARLGDIPAHQKRAIQIIDWALKYLDPHSKYWGQMQMSLGATWLNLPTGRRVENLNNALAAYNAAMTVFTKQSYPFDWAIVQVNLGDIYRELPTPDGSVDVAKAIAAQEAALTVLTLEANPFEWASAQQSLGSSRSTDENQEAGKFYKALTCYHEAGKVFTKQAYPFDWAALQIDVAVVYLRMPDDASQTNMQKGITALNDALTVLTPDNYPLNWALAQRNLGAALGDLSIGDRVDNLNQAIAAFNAALTIYKKDSFPSEWAKVQLGLANAESDMPIGDKTDHLRRAIAFYEDALTVLDQHHDPTNWGIAQKNLGYALMHFEGGDRTENLTNSIAAYNEAMKVITKKSDPMMWASIKANIAHDLASLPLEDNAENLQKAIAADKDALTVFTRQFSPAQWAQVQAGLGNLWFALPTGDRAQNLMNAMAASKAALSVPENQFPGDARIDAALTLASCQLATKDFSGALATSTAIDPSAKNLSLQMIRAHALLFSGRTNEALDIYLKYVGITMNGVTWEQSVLSNFDTMEQQGLTCPQMAEVRQELQKRSK